MVATVGPALVSAALLSAAAVVLARLVLGGGGCSAAAEACPMPPLRGDFRDAALLVFGAATGTPVVWEPAPAPVPGPAGPVAFSLAAQVPYAPWTAVAVLLPVLPGLLMAYAVSRRARRTGVRRFRLLIPALAGYGLGLLGALLLLSALPENGGLTVHSLPAGPVALLGTVWAGASATAALALVAAVSTAPTARDGRGARRRRTDRRPAAAADRGPP
ncbi:hypothetical protein [Streptomonospora salina]|uniref:Uncharacterized protein n=1 Tax=Streptomonospora salina TaxID=104205 RepID=A0A841E4N1_9ACTN|nr:hypothetical protein [Streptomonospora salina]MBB5998817.1 hypothetical protein [Streptomonospora salina]